MLKLACTLTSWAIDAQKSAKHARITTKLAKERINGVLALCNKLLNNRRAF